MPWDASAVVVLPLVRRAGATIGAAALEAAAAPWRVAGGPAESVGQPAWARDGSLRFVSDRRGWWQPYVHPGLPGEQVEPTALTLAAAEFHGPDWVLSQTTIAELGDGTVVARMTTAGRDALVWLARDGSADGPPPPAVLEQPCVSIAALCAHGDGLALIGSTPQPPSNVWVLTPEGVCTPCARVPRWLSGEPTWRQENPSR